LEYGAQLKAKEDIFAEILADGQVERNLIMPIVGRRNLMATVQGPTENAPGEWK
jgi:hypothetical protein